MEKKLKDHIAYYKESIANSYSQVFFSNNGLLALLALLASFVDPATGISGLVCSVASIIFAKGLGFDEALIRNGTYSYNSLLAGLAIGSIFQLNAAFFIIVCLAALLTLFITAFFSSVFTTARVPFLSLPFLISIWILLPGLQNFGTLHISERAIYSFNSLWHIGGVTLVNMYEKATAWQFPYVIEVYLKSLGAIYFQYNIISGILIAVGLFIYSRIAFSLSLIGFLTGYLFCVFVRGDLSELEYSYIGFNYILTGIALGGFFLIPSKRSYLLACIAMPLVGLAISAFGQLLAVFHLPMYSLPFSIVVIMIMAALSRRYSIGKLQPVEFQLFSPEKNLYGWASRRERFKNDTWFHIHLPFYGKWKVSQGHDGAITHKEGWRFAWDFVVTDELQKTYRGNGTDVSDFYCYGLPVLAPCAGYVVNLLDEVDDNAIGDVNLTANWGNTIVIKHSDYLFSKISHIKKGSFKVKTGDYVKKGEILAVCGNSGRSPEPHVHFQLQATPHIGAKTIEYPLAYYVSQKNNRYEFHSFDYPEQGQEIFRALPDPLISKAFDFVPGMVMEFVVSENGKASPVKWEVFVDALNQSYIYCYATRSVAYFSNNDTLHYFTSFKGDHESLLYYFYLAAHKVLLSYFEGLRISDTLPVTDFHNGPVKIVQDIIAPFYLFLKTKYVAAFKKEDDGGGQKIMLLSTVTSLLGNSEKTKIDFELVLEQNKISQLKITGKNKSICAQNIH